MPCTPPASSDDDPFLRDAYEVILRAATSPTENIASLFGVLLLADFSPSAADTFFSLTPLVPPVLAETCADFFSLSIVEFAALLLAFLIDVLSFEEMEVAPWVDSIFFSDAYMFPSKIY
jgi:hypothetical protein